MTINAAAASPCNQAQPAATACVVGTPCFTRILTGNDPGVVGPSSNTSGPDGDEDEVEAILDVEWSGAVAPMANIDLVTSADTNTDAGIDLSAEYIVDNNLAPILSESYGVCELDATTAGNAFYNTMWSQAAGEGITVLVSSGDSGSAGCDGVNPSGPASQPATGGLAVNAIASTQYDVAVGGTDVNDPNPFVYFSNTNNGTTGLSALSYIPESTWNDTCTNSLIFSFFGTSTAEGTCNDTTAQNDDLVQPVGGSGGVSGCTSSNGSTPGSCSGGYAKPSWQTGPGVPNDGRRDVPDVSLFGATGTISGTSYIDCEADFLNSSNQPLGPCSFSTQAPAFLEIGGTSASVQALAGVMASIVQNTGGPVLGRQGNANPMFYSLAAEQSPAACNSSSAASTCVFHDVTVGTNTVPCAKSSPNCTVTTSSDTIGVLTTTSATTTVSAYNAGTGYDLATGLGTPNVANLISGWGPNFYISFSNESATISSGSPGALTITVTGVDGFAGSVSGFACSNLPSGASCAFTCPGGETSCAANGGSPIVTLSAIVTSATVNVSISTTAGMRGAPTTRPSAPSRWNSVGVTGLISLLMGSFWIVNARGKRWNWKPALALMAFAVVLGVAGCSGGSKSSGGGATGSTIVTVSATSGASTTSTTFTLSVQ
jgi:hypothetical protein